MVQQQYIIAELNDLEPVDGGNMLKKGLTFKENKNVMKESLADV